MTIKNTTYWLRLALSAGFIFVGQPIVQAQSTNQEQLSQRQVLPISATANLAGQTFNLEVAETLQQQAIGLKNRTFLPDNQGMLFPQTPSPAVFWMRNTLIPLDLIFLYKSTVVEIAQNVQPCLTEYCPLYSPVVDVNQIANISLNDIFLFKSKPVGINGEGFEKPQDIAFINVDSVIEVKGGRTGEVGLSKGTRIIISPIPESSSSLGTLIFAIFSVLQMKYQNWKRKSNRSGG
ncbi:DUF192 domain-containing protein [Nostoc sp. CHAB 5784]|uniref:DUF192 domain-containing protein n=1 Tax=Nostoc mirabile TaxID=2907820 RepID=UPI001E62158A|nr:DUF192 domain-containing protein [Nostoc mirabile]MCC5670502.1 DUF192 domain-containing protein [Nostoc mirabile CHAB5784]